MATARRTRRWGFLILPPFIIALVALGVFGVDQLCISDANRRLPYYPGAERFEETHNGLRVRGIGNTLEVVLTPDTPEQVEAWYRQRAIELLNSGRPRGVASLNHWHEANPEGEGTFIFYLSQCVL